MRSGQNLTALPRGIPLDKANFRQYINFLQQYFPALSLSQITKLADMSLGRVAYLFSDTGAKHIRPKEITALFQVYEDLKNGKATYIPDQLCRQRRRKDNPSVAPLDKANLRQYIDFLLTTFPHLDIEEISRRAKIDRSRLEHLLNEPKSYRFVLSHEVARLFQVYEKLRSRQKNKT